MERKKVKSVTLTNDEVKKRNDEESEKKSVFINSSNDTKVKWDKIKNVNATYITSTI